MDGPQLIKVNVKSNKWIYILGRQVKQQSTCYNNRHSSIYVHMAEIKYN